MAEAPRQERLLFVTKRITVQIIKKLLENFNGLTSIIDQVLIAYIVLTC
jgi:hypothetical protein